MSEKFKNYFGALDLIYNRIMTAPGYIEFYLYMPEHIILTPEELMSVCGRHMPGGGMIGIKQRGVPRGQPFKAYIWESRWHWKKSYDKGVIKVGKMVNKKVKKNYKVAGRV